MIKAFDKQSLNIKSVPYIFQFNTNPDIQSI